MTGGKISDQIAFQFPLVENFVFSDFVHAGNEELITALKQCEHNPQFSFIWVWGLSGRGKSHLLQASCHAHSGTAVYLPAKEISLDSPVLEGIGGYQLVVIDDVQFWLGQREQEAQLMALYTSLLQNDGQLIVSSALAPKNIRFSLPDLASRAVASQTFELQPVAGDALSHLLTRLAKKRGLVLEPEVVTYWLNRRRRELSSLIDDLEALDKASLSAVRRLTVPFLKQVLNI